jgi:hypothetical protein
LYVSQAEVGDLSANCEQSLAVDELVDDGIILETDPVIVASRVSRPPAQDMTSMKNIDLSEQGFLNAWEFGKRALAERVRQGL